MRLILGMILGALMTIGAAYISDSASAPSPSSPSAYRPMVNWDVVGENWGSLTGRVRDQWNKLSSVENR